MKAVMAFVCSLVLLVAPMLSARPLAPCGASPAPACQRACCQGGHPMSCCAAAPVTASRPVSIPVRSVSQNDFSLLALALLTTSAPVAEVRPVFLPVLPPVTLAGTLLHERLCVRLI